MNTPTNTNDQRDVSRYSKNISAARLPKMTNWRVLGRDDGDWVICAPDRSGKTRSVARVHNEPHARLIAAAPELLDALRGTMAALARILDKHDPDSNEYEWIGEANEAILKATTPDK